MLTQNFSRSYRQIGLTAKWNIRSLSAQAQAQVKVNFEFISIVTKV